MKKSIFCSSIPLNLYTVGKTTNAITLWSTPQTPPSLEQSLASVSQE